MAVPKACAFSLAVVRFRSFTMTTSRCVQSYRSTDILGKISLDGLQSSRRKKAVAVGSFCFDKYFVPLRLYFSRFACCSAAKPNLNISTCAKLFVVGGCFLWCLHSLSLIFLF